jgi:hypothetical protein
VLQYTDTLGGRFAEIEGGDLLQELHLYAQQQLTPTEKARAKTHIAH